MALKEVNELESIFRKAKDRVPDDLKEEFDRDLNVLISIFRDIIAAKKEISDSPLSPEQEVENFILDWIEETRICLKRELDYQ